MSVSSRAMLARVHNVLTGSAFFDSLHIVSFAQLIQPRNLHMSVCFLSVVYLPLSAVHIALQAGTGDNVYWVNDVVTGLVVMLQAVFIVGLRLLADAMEKPYESDVEDLSVMHYISKYLGGLPCFRFSVSAVHPNIHSHKLAMPHIMTQQCLRGL